MNKLLTYILVLFVLIGCSTNKEIPSEPVINPEVKFSYQIKENLIFNEGETLDFTGVVVGNFDSYEIGPVNNTLGDHILSVTLIKDNQEKVIAVPYTVKEKELSSNYYLESLSVDGYQLEPVFQPEIDVYTVKIPEKVVSININAKTQDFFASITGGTGIVSNPGVDFEHHVTIKAEDQTEFYYLIIFELEEPEVVETPVDEPVSSSDIEVWNGYELNYPSSELATFRNDLLTLVNKSYRLEESYIPSDLVLVPQEYQVYGGAHLVQEAYNAYLKMRQAASEEGLNLNVSTCYRSYDLQRTLYTGYLSGDTQESVDTYSARPGHSEHQLGYACDFAAGMLNIDDFTGTAEETWMRDNAVDYGFILRFPEGKSDITGYMYESWHYRYVGLDNARAIKDSGLTLEEYLGY